MECNMTYEVARVQRIPIRLHLSLLILGLLFVLQFGLWGLPAGIVVFGSVLLHELGHALVARRLGVPTVRIDLHLLGGTALLKHAPRSSEDEAWIAVAGPAVSLSLASVLGALAMSFGSSLRLDIEGFGDLLAYAGVVNLGLGLFNLIPALPMDGGRILRAWLTTRYGVIHGTQVAASVSRVFGGLFVAVALFVGSLTIGLIGVALFFLSVREERMVRAAITEHFASYPHPMCSTEAPLWGWRWVRVRPFGGR
ncbi:MAG: M50 family metallopeptidase [Myxococcales bacterium]|nr:M50 family metallopeptidase [Myxococcales bacterium]